MRTCMSKMKRIGVILACSCSLLVAENLLSNSNFEEGAKDWQQWGAIETSHSYAGAKAMKVTNTTNVWSGISQVVPVLEGTSHFTVSGWMKTDEVVSGNEFWEKAQIVVEFLDDQGKPIEHYPEQTALAAGTNDWRFYEKNYPIHPQATAIKVVAALGNATGSASFDQLQLVQQKEDGSVQQLKDLKEFYTQKQNKQNEAHSTLPNGDFEEDKKHWSTYGVSVTESGKDGSMALYLNNKIATWAGASQVLELPESANKVVVSGWMKTKAVVRGKEGWDKALLNIEYQDSLGQKVGDYPESIGQMEGTSDWDYFQGEFGINKGATQLKLFCQLCNAKGEAWFDDIKVVIYDTAGNQIQ